jgi:N-carbamoylputrescine amidase
LFSLLKVTTMAKLVRVAATQMACCMDKETNKNTAEQLVRDAAKAGANIILLPELFEGLYFCQVAIFFTGLISFF